MTDRKAWAAFGENGHIVELFDVGFLVMDSRDSLVDCIGSDYRIAEVSIAYTPLEDIRRKARSKSESQESRANAATTDGSEHQGASGGLADGVSSGSIDSQPLPEGTPND